MNETFNRRLSRRASALMLLSATLTVGAVELQALRAREPANNLRKKRTAADCVRCHNTKKAIAIMRMKEDGGQFLFNKDGTFKNPGNVAPPRDSVHGGGHPAANPHKDGW